MSKLSKREQVVEEVVMLLLSLGLEERGEAWSEANDMATRAAKGWWEIPGRPHYNMRLARIKRKSKL